MRALCIREREQLNAYFGSFSNGNSGVTLGLTIGIVEFIKRN